MVHLVGIGGAGMSAIAKVLLEMGYRVEGSDLKESPNVRRLRELGAAVGLGHRADNLGETRVVIYSSAVAADNVELAAAAEAGIPVVSRAGMLAAIMATRTGIAVAGTHGKTTTSSMVTQALLACGADPSFLIGGELNEIGSNANYGSGRYLVAEADESDGSLLRLRPHCAVLTNIELDHPDFYESIEHTSRVFSEFLALLSPGGFAVVCGDDARARDVGEERARAGGRVVFYGAGEANDYSFAGEECSRAGCRYEARYLGTGIGGVELRVPGRHNVYNSLAALAVCRELGFEVEPIARGLESFRGVKRRFERVGGHDGITVFDDYAHHPTEVRTVLEMAATIGPGRVVVVFQPHRYSRTARLADDFGESFGPADMVIISDVYGAGEEPEPGVSGKLVADAVLRSEPTKELFYVPSREELAASVAPLLESGDTVITMGAGDITRCGREILEILQRREG